MLNRRVMLLQIFLVLFILSAAFGQDVEVLKAELKGMEGRLDAKIDGVKDTLDAKIDGVKDTLDQKITGTKDELTTSINGVKDELTTSINGVKDELTASINGVKSEVRIIRWIIGGIGAVFTIFLGFFGYLLNYFVKQLLPNMVQPGSRSTGQPQQEPISGSEFADNTETGYQTAGGGS